MAAVGQQCNWDGRELVSGLWSLVSQRPEKTRVFCWSLGLLNYSFGRSSSRKNKYVRRRAHTGKNSTRNRVFFWEYFSQIRNRKLNVFLPFCYSKINSQNRTESSQCKHTKVHKNVWTLATSGKWQMPNSSDNLANYSRYLAISAASQMCIYSVPSPLPKHLALEAASWLELKSSLAFCLGFASESMASFCCQGIS